MIAKILHGHGRTLLRVRPLGPIGASETSPGKIMEEKHAGRVLFFRQEELFQDLFDPLGHVGGD
jgi:hypothetical protein